MSDLPEISSKISPRLVKIFTAVVVLTIGLFGSLVWYTWDTFRYLDTTQKNYFRLTELSGSIVHLDEVLTMSARMAAATGDQTWEARYRRFETKLDAAIKEAMVLGQGFSLKDAADKTDTANLKLVDMENQVFDLVRKGQTEKAAAILSSAEYDVQKKIYISDIAQINETTRGNLEKNITEYRHRGYLAISFILIVTPCLVFGWILVARLIRQHNSNRKQAEEALTVRERSYRTLAENIPEIVYRVHVREKGRMQFFNSMLMTVTGYNEEELIEGEVCSIDPLIVEEDRDRIIAEVNAAIKDNRSFSLEYRITHKDGTPRFLIERGRPIFDNDGLHSIDGIIQDVTARKRVEEELRRNQDVAERLGQEIAIIAEIGQVIGSTLDTEEVYERFAAETQKLILFDSLTINLYNFQQNTLCVAYVSGLDIDGRRQGDPLVLEGSLSEAVIRVRTGLRIQPVSIDEIVGQFPRLTPIFQAGLRSIMCVPLVYRDEVIGVLHFRSKKPNAYTEQDLHLAERIGEQIAGAIANAQLYAGLKKKERGLKESEQRYRELSMVDDLTQLYNSRHFYFQLKIELDRSNRYGQPLTLLLLDLDNFKVFNDTYGHVEGDQVLSRLGQVVKRCLRETDFAYRYGGEEFTILLPMTTSTDAAITAERIRTEFKKEHFSPAPDQEIHVTVSIGLAQYKPQEDMKGFVHRVDQLMYQGKKNGKDRVCSEP